MSLFGTQPFHFSKEIWLKVDTGFVIQVSFFSLLLEQVQCLLHKNKTHFINVFEQIIYNCRNDLILHITTILKKLSYFVIQLFLKDKIHITCPKNYLLYIWQKNSFMLEEMDQVILNLIEFGILDKLFKGYDFSTSNEGIYFVI